MKFLAAIFMTVMCFSADWIPVERADLARKTPKVDAAADAEAIFWDVRVEDRAEGGEPSTVLNHYIRIKIYTEKGKDDHGTVEIASGARVSISDVAGRTLKQDGSILELKKDAIFERDLVKTKGLKLKGKSFAMPGVEVGDVIEYRWKETRRDQLADYIRLYFQREIPVWEVMYHIKPLSLPGFPLGMRSFPKNADHTPFVKEKDGFYLTTMSRVPAYREEPRMPPEDEVKAWMLLYYSDDDAKTPEQFWKSYSRRLYEEEKPFLKADDAIKKLAAELISGAATEEEKLARLDVYCKTKIKNIFSESSGYTAEQRRDFKPNKSPSQTVKQGAGTARDISLLFAALASAAGFETHLTRVPDRGDTFFNTQVPNGYFLNTYNIAVKSDSSWKFYDPGTQFLESGMLRWQEEGVMALMLDPKQGSFVKTPMSPPSRSVRKRVAKMKLLADGTLEGEVKLEYTGHPGMTQKRLYAGKSPAEREELFKEGIVNRLSTAEVTGLQLENADHHALPMRVSYRVKVPGYAQRTGRRLFLQPAFFQRNLGAEFTESTRKNMVYFQYPWSEVDEILIELPAGWELDGASAPQSSAFAKVGSYAATLGVAEGGRGVVYTRKMEFGNNDMILFPVQSYPSLKAVFDFVHQQDNHAITLKQSAR
jgi:hypothetical protein